MKPALFAVPLGVTFATAFARGFWDRYGELDPLLLAQGRIFVNTPRAGLRIAEALAAEASGSRLLPRIEPLDRVGADPLDPANLAPAIDPMHRHLVLVRLVEAYVARTENAPAPEAAPALAEALARLIDELDEEGIDPACLETAADSAHAAHWSQSLAFLELICRHWPEIRERDARGAPDPVPRRRAAVAALKASWRAAPPEAPVIAAGSTGSRAITAELMAAIGDLPRGAVVLPGIDTEMAGSIGRIVDGGGAPEHPQAPFARLLGLTAAARSDIAPWVPDARCPMPARRRLLEEAMRPAPVTDAWRSALPALAAEAGEALAGVALVEAANSREEAGAIAVAIREALGTPGRRSVLVTPNPVLARRVTAELARYAIVPDDASGRPLNRAPAGVLLRLVLDVAGQVPDPVRLAGLLGHPLVRAGLERPAHLAFARAYQLKVLRKTPARDAAPGTLPGWPEASEPAAAWLAGISAAIAPLAEALSSGAALEGLVAAHRTATGTLASGPGQTSGGALWEGGDGAAIAAALDRLSRTAGAYGGASATRVYPQLLADLLSGLETRPLPGETHPRVAIVGPREARTETADLFILGGLAESAWPALPGPDPWLSRAMRARIGLPEPETRIGLSAHDFLHSAVRPEVILTRTETAGGSPALPSRWLVRLTGLLGAMADGAPLAAIRARGDRLLALARRVHRPDRPAAPAPRPAPVPKARLSRLSVTQLERLVADAYAIYARHLLELAPLDPLGRPPDLRDRGIVLHEVLRHFTLEPEADKLPLEAARARLLALADAELADKVLWPDRRRIWRHRLERAAEWFLEGEAERRRAGTPIARECLGSLIIEAPGGPFKITAKADRIDRLGDGGAAIFDYKTGRPPTKADISGGRVHQLHVQGAMLEAGGFEEVGAERPVCGAYIGLTGSGLGGELTPVADLSGGIGDHLARLEALIAALDGGAPYTARGRPDFAPGQGEYDHLSRRAEWEGT